MSGTRRVAWFHCFAGVAGDMAFASLIDAGADIDEVNRLLVRLPVGGWSLDVRPTQRGGIAATRLVVRGADDAVVRTHSHIVGLIEEARLPDRVRDRALGVFAALARVEGRLHRRPPSQVHFHEVGGIDAIVDIVGTCSALEILGIDHITTSPIATGTGMVRTSHGLLPNPAPAVVELLRGLPTYGRDIAIELTTPTGAALVATLASGHGPLPAMTVDSTGFGSGTRDLGVLPNLTQVVVGDAGAEQPTGQPVVLIETNVDDATGETLAHAISALLDAGCHDAWVTPAVMKKGRPGHVVCALVDPAVAASAVAVMRAETGSLGVRGRTVERWPSPRSVEEVEVEGMPVRVKVSPGRVKAEHDDVARLARLRGLPVREAARRAEEAWWHRSPGSHPPGGDSVPPDDSGRPPSPPEDSPA